MSFKQHLTLITLTILLTMTNQQALMDDTPPPLNPTETESIYLALHSIDPTTPWRTLYPDDLCLSPPHGVVCQYDDVSFTPHVTEFNLGYLSDTSPYPSCSPNATFPTSLHSLPRLRKLLFFRCFTSLPVLPDLPNSLEELVLLQNPGLSGTMHEYLGNTTSGKPPLRKFILTGSNVTGGIPDIIGEFPLLEQVTISGNKNLRGEMPTGVGRLKELKILDLSGNGLEGRIPESLGHCSNLLKLDLSYNNLNGGIPESLVGLKSLLFLDLGYNKLGEDGLPRFLGELRSLKEVHLNGNNLGGVIPEIWENLGGILGIGLSGVGLVGNIPPSMGVYLRSVSYILLDDNKLEGTVPKEFELLGNVHEVNLRNNRLSGKLPFTVGFVSRVGKKLKLEGNSGICVDQCMKLSIQNNGIGTSLMNLKTCNSTAIDAVSETALLVDASGTSDVNFVGWSILVILGVVLVLVLGL